MINIRKYTVDGGVLGCILKYIEKLVGTSELRGLGCRRHGTIS